MKKLFSLFLIITTTLLFSQVGIGTTTPRGGLDINKPITNIYGLVLPTNSNPANMQNPQGGNVPEGTLMYDSTQDCIRLYKKNANGGGTSGWSDCLGAGSLSSGGVTVDCSASGNGFNGNYKKGTALTSINTFKVTIVNNSLSVVNFSSNTNDLTLSGVGGISVASVSPATVNINGGESTEVTYTLSGTPDGCCSLQGDWVKRSLHCTGTVSVEGATVFDCSKAAWSVAVSPEYKLAGLMNGQSYSGVYSIPYSDGSCSLAPDILSAEGLTFSYAGGSASGSGTIDYVLSGTYQGADHGAVTFTTASGCQVYIGVCSSCKELLAQVPGTSDGVYWIDPDHEGTGFSPIKAQCDMSTDGGGWTLILNYLHQGGATSPALNLRLATLPVIGSSTLGDNEAGHPDFWGNAGRSLQSALNSTEYLFYGITSFHSRVIHFKTPHAASIHYFKTGSGNAGGIRSSFTPFSDHTAMIPGAANSTITTTVSGRELCEFPFYRAGQYTWGIAGSGSNNRWEVDDFPNNSSRNTLHRVWVR